MTEYDYKKDLPYLGKETKDEYRPVVVGDPEHFCFYNARPNYNDFKSKVYNTETDCVSVLTGLMTPNAINKLCEDKPMNANARWIFEADCH